MDGNMSGVSKMSSPENKDSGCLPDKHILTKFDPGSLSLNTHFKV